jgi:hypothetical protein
MRITSVAFTFVLINLFGFSALSPAPSQADTATTSSFVLQAQPTPTQPDAMPVIITEVKGMVQYRDDESLPWHIATAQARISEGAELRTGPHSSVTCVIPPDQTFTLDRLGVVRVEEAAKHGNKVSTDLIMKYGRTRYDIEAVGLEHEAKISSPSSTLAVRGTRVSLYDQVPYQPEAISYTGRAQFTYKGNTTGVGKKHGNFTRLIAGADGASQTGVDQTVVDPQEAAARSAADADLIATEVSRGAILSYDPIANIPVITNGRPFTDAELPSNLPGALDVVLRWTGDADLNLEVGLSKGDPATILATTGFVQGELLYPGYGYQNSPSGGHIPYDNRGGPTGGEEFAYWSGSYPNGIYGLAAIGVSGVPTSATLDIYADGKLVPQYYFNNGVFVHTTQVTTQISPGQQFSTIALVPSLAALLAVVPVDPNGDPNPGINAATVHASFVHTGSYSVLKASAPAVKSPR